MSEIAAAAAIVLTLYVLAVLFAFWRERHRLSRFVERATTLFEARRATRSLGDPFSRVAEKAFEPTHDPEDETARIPGNLGRALSLAAAEPLETLWFGHLAMQTLLILVAMSPLTVALVQGALELPQIFAPASDLPPSLTYLSTVTRADAVFGTIRQGAQTTGWLVSYLAIGWSIAWWTYRPEAREIRFVRSLLQVAAQVKSAAEIRGDLLLVEALNPRRSLRQPLCALALWVVAVSVGWLILVATAVIRSSNPAEPQFQVLKTQRSMKVVPASGIAIPLGRGGHIRTRDETYSISIGPDSVGTADAELGILSDDRRSVAAWSPNNLDRLAPSESVHLFGHGPLAMEPIKATLSQLTESKGITDWHIVVRRAVGGQAEPSSVYVTIPLSLVAQGRALLDLHVRHSDVVVNGTTRFAFERPKWRTKFRQTVRTQLSLEALKQNRPVRVSTDDEVNFDRFVEVLGAADDGCHQLQDCGLPGLGLRFVLVP